MFSWQPDKPVALGRGANTARQRPAQSSSLFCDRCVGSSLAVHSHRILNIQSSAVRHVHDEVALNRVAHADSSLVCDPPHPRVRYPRVRRPGGDSAGEQVLAKWDWDGRPYRARVMALHKTSRLTRCSQAAKPFILARLSQQSSQRLSTVKLHQIISLSPTQTLKACPLAATEPSPCIRICLLHPRTLHHARTSLHPQPALQQHLSRSPASQARNWLPLPACRQLMPISSFPALSLPLSTARRSLLRVSFVGYETDPQQWTSVSRMERIGGSESRASS